MIPILVCECRIVWKSLTYRLRVVLSPSRLDAMQDMARCTIQNLIMKSCANSPLTYRPIIPGRFPATELEATFVHKKTRKDLIKFTNKSIVTKFRKIGQSERTKILEKTVRTSKCLECRKIALVLVFHLIC